MKIPVVVSGARQDHKNVMEIDGRLYFVRRGPVEDAGGLMLVDVLMALTPKFDGVPSHQGHAKQRPESLILTNLIRPLIGYIRRPHWDQSNLAVLADLEVNEDQASLVFDLRARGWGFSPTLEGLVFRQHCRMQNQRSGVWVDVLMCDSVAGVRSVDCVPNPSLGGRFLSPKEMTR